MKTMIARECLKTSALAAFDVRCSAAGGSHSGEEVSEVPTFVIPRRGVFVWTAGKRSMIVDPNVVLLSHPREPHSVFHPVEGGDDCTSLRVHADTIERALQHRSAASRYWILDAATQRRVHAAAHIIRQSPDTLESEEAALSILSAVSDAPEPRHSRHTSAVDAVRERIACNPAERATLESLAQGTGLSPYELARIFRARTGTSIHQYRLTLRLLTGLARLRDGHDDITALSLELGFANHAHFTSSFTRAFGMPPSAARSRRLKRTRTNNLLA